MTVELLAAVIPLALLDSLNPGTIAGAVYLLLTPHPTARTVAYIAGTGVPYYAGGVLIYLGLGPALRDLPARIPGPLLDGGLAVVGAVLVGMAEWLRRRPRRTDASPRTPRVLHPGATLLFGASGTLFDLPTALPLFVAIERLAASGAERLPALLSLAVYVLVYCLPLLILLGASLVLRSRAAGLMRGFTAVVQRWSRPALVAGLYAAGGLLIANGLSAVLRAWPP
jgi:cytochrome c biogenesis protein CcdA